MKRTWDWRFMRKARWWFGTIVVLGAAVVWINLGFWQVRRLHQSEQHNAAVKARMQAQPMPLSEALARFDFTVPLTAPNSADYRRVRVTGRYDPTDEVLLRSRSLGGHPGFDVLTPLELKNGKALLVNRGWVPYTDSNPPLPVAAPPSGDVTVTGLLHDPDPLPTGFFKRLSPQDPATGPLKKTFYANPQRLQAQMPFPLVGGYVQLLTQAPKQSGQLPVPTSPPQLSNGSHLSYAFQWFAFTAILLVGYGVVLVRKANDPDGTEAERKRRWRAAVEAAAAADTSKGGSGDGTAPGD